MQFQKLIPDYINNSLDESTLNEFLKHFNECKKCRDELEIHYIVMKGVDILDRKDANYDLCEAFRNSITKSIRYLKSRKSLIAFSYVIDSCVFWCVLISVLIYIRLYLK